uniref:SNF2 N-terminal domain-containing protein n=1 Tax=Amphimedon queenslandica TaxID=400682 RepID=A0A1X7UUW6_AMPQE
VTDTSGKAKRSAHPTLFHIHWKRIILDEAHIVRNSKSATSEAVDIIITKLSLSLNHGCCKYNKE